MRKWKSDPFKVRKSRQSAPRVQKSEKLQNLLALKLQIEALKPLYGQYDLLLQDVLNSGKLNGHPQLVTLDGVKWIIEAVDGFSNGRNTAWKSVATRRFDIAVTKVKTISVRG